MSRRSETTTKVFVGSLPADATTDDLKRLFEPYGAIAECDIANRCGFLHLEDKDLAMKAIEELNNTTFMGVRISVEKGRVKPPNRSRGRGGAGGGPMRGGRERGGPYSRDGFGRSRVGGFGGREYPPYGDRYDYDRAAMPRFDPGYGSERRPPGYDDRRGAYMGERGRSYSNGFDRRSAYDDRPSYLDSPRGAYDDRRPPASTPVGFDERRPPVGERRPLMEPQMGQSSRPPISSYDRGSSSDMFSRRGDPAPKPLDRPTAAAYGSSGAYSSTGAGAYGSTSNLSSAYGGYGDGRSAGSMGYDSRGTLQGAGYGDSRGPTGSAYGDSRGTTALSTSMYGESRSTSVPYGGAVPSSGYNSGTGSNYNDTYGAARSGSYDAAYPPLPQQRGFASGGGPTPRRDLPPGPGHRI